MTNLKQYLEDEIKNWEFVGHAALMQRFVVRNGKEFTPTKRIGRKGTPKQCFMNATKAMQRRPLVDHQLEGWRYVEGFAIQRHNPLLAFHHAWITTTGDDAMDPTLPDSADYCYVGVTFDRKTVAQEIMRNGFYGILDTGLGLNVRLMFALDPELQSIVEAVKPSFAWERLHQMQKEAQS